MEHFAFKGKIMEDVLDEPEEEDLETRNECIEAVLDRLDLSKVNAPFPYVGVKDGTFMHYDLTRYSAIKGPLQPFIPDEPIVHSIIWFATYMWGGTMPFVHGDMTDSNVIFNPPFLFVIDFEPGLVELIYLTEGQTEENIRKISADLIDFLTSVRTLNRKHIPDYTINHLFHFDVDEMIDNWQNKKILPQLYRDRMIHFFRQIFTPENVERLFPTQTAGKRTKRKKTRRHFMYN